MSFDEYQIKAHSTAVHGGTLAYPIGSLAEETGEVCEVWGNWCAFADTLQPGYSEVKDKLLDELGDVAWNAAELATLLDVKFSLVFPANNAGFESKIQSKTYYICNLAAKVGKLNGVWTKYIRKHNGVQPDKETYPIGSKEPSEDEAKLYENLLGALNNVMIAYRMALTALELDDTEVLQHNVDKLAARKANNTLGGAGSVERK